MTQATATRTVKVTFTEQESIRCVARQDMPEYGIKAGDIFYLSRSSRDNGDYYITRYDEKAACWFCSCPSRKPCRHEKNAGQAAHARRVRLQQLAAKAVLPSQVAQAARTTRQPVITSAKPATPRVAASQPRYEAPLNGNRPFSLLRA
ncbi:MAG: hypothetical protein J2P36_03495 [Ktedonobacteraceae bacterium]|nr:hypothetical protein [Ktedonobacteraceae bacterium]